MHGRIRENSQMRDKDESQDGGQVQQSRIRLVKQSEPAWKRGNANNAGQRTDEDPANIAKTTKLDKKNANNTSLNKRYNRLRIAKNKSRPRFAGGVVWKGPSVPMDAGWNVIHDFDPASRLDSLSADVGEGKDILVAGSLRKLKPGVRAAVAAEPQPLVPSPGVFQGFQRAVDDDHMLGLMGENAGTVYATDTAISILMNAKKIQKPWDLVFTVYGGSVMVIDARDTATQMELEVETVHETSRTPPWNDGYPDGAPALAREATTATRHLREMMVHSGAMRATPARATMPPQPVEAHPLQVAADAAGKEPASVLYRYRRFALGEEQLVVRTTLHAASTVGSSTKLHSIFALTERWDETTAASEWKRTVRERPGSVITDEIQLNTAKFGKWVASALLAGADFISLGLVTRASKADATKHNILHVAEHTPTSLARPLAMSPANMWGVVAWAIELVREQVRELQEARRDGGDLGADEEDEMDYKFLLMRWPETETGIKASIKLVEVRPTDFVTEEDDEEADEDEEGAATIGFTGGAGAAAAASASAATA